MKFTGQGSSALLKQRSIADAFRTLNDSRLSSGAVSWRLVFLGGPGHANMEWRAEDFGAHAQGFVGFLGCSTRA
jgi:hypothetical protein